MHTNGKLKHLRIDKRVKISALRFSSSRCFLFLRILALFKRLKQKGYVSCLRLRHILGVLLSAVGVNAGIPTPSGSVQGQFPGVMRRCYSS